MDDLISRQAAKDALANLVPYAICDVATESYTNGLTDAYNLICQLPSADAVSVVRCEDCRWWDDVPSTDGEPDHECHLFDGNEENLRIATPPNWFCPKGERRSE